MVKKLYGGHEKGAEDDIFRPKKKHQTKRTTSKGRAIKLHTDDAGRRWCAGMLVSGDGKFELDLRNGSMQLLV